MAMDDQIQLAKAIAVDGVMTRPTKYRDGNIPTGPWIEAEILEVSLTVNHPRGWYFGAVRYCLRGQPENQSQRAEVRTFHDLWMESWTSLEVRERFKADLRRKPLRRKPKR